MKATSRIAAFGLLLLVSCSSRPLLGASFHGLPYITGQSNANSVTADGTVAVGFTQTLQSPYFESGAEWTNGNLTSQLDNFADNGAMVGALISGDGSTIVGGGISDSIPLQIVVGKGGSLTPLGTLAPGITNQEVARGISYNGSVIVGQAQDASGETEAFYWHNGAMTGLGFLPGGPINWSAAWGVSADGNVVVGQSYSAQSTSTQPFRWVSDGMGGGTMNVLPYYAGQTGAVALAVSADGNVVVGSGGNYGSSLESLMWNNGAVTSLGILPGFTSSEAQAVSGDGSIVVGWNFFGTNNLNRQAYIWTQATGMVSLQSYLVANGATGLTGWTLCFANAISTDGRTIVGDGYNPQGGLQAWSATIPEPSTLALLGLGIGLLAVTRRVRRS